MILAGFVFPPIDELFVWPDFAFKNTNYAINKTSLLVFISSALVILLLLGVSRRMKLVPSGMQNVVEAGWDLVDKGITKDVVGANAPYWTTAYLGSLFFFILALNMWATIPFIMFPPTARFGIPLFLALMTYVIFLFVGFKTSGFKYLTIHLFPPGVPIALYILVTPIEFVSIFLVRPFSLAVRLLANMMAGHILLTAMALLTAYAITSDSPLGKVIAVGPFLMNIGIVGFELLVAVLQAYIFTLLSAVYIAESLHPDH
jgi:F-type H+-transporting ATPase subunit a